MMRKLTRVLLPTLVVFCAAVSTASAATVTKTFTGSVIGGPFAGTVGTGSLGFDDVDVAALGAGLQSLTPGSAPAGFSVSLTIFGQTFTELDDVDFNIAPSIRFVDGVLTGLDFLIDSSVTSITQSGVAQISIFGNFVPSTQPNIDFNIVVEAIPTVPEPGTIALFGLGLVGLVAGRRRIR